MLSTFAVCVWATTALAACSVRTRVHYVRADDRSRGGEPYYSQRLQSRASSMFGPSGQPAAAAGFPYRFVFPASHPALSGSVYSQYQHNPHQSEPLYSAEDLFTLPSSNHHPSSDHKHYQHQQQNHQQQQLLQQQQRQQQPLGFETVGKLQYDFLGGGNSAGGGKHHHVQPAQPYHMVKQPKHYQSYELAPNAGIPVHQSPYPLTAGASSVSQPIMLLIPSSGQPGAPYQTLVLVPSSTPLAQPSPVNFPGFHQQIQHMQAPPQFMPGFITHPRGAPVISGFPPGHGGNGLGKFSGTQLLHRSHDPLQHQQQQQMHHTQLLHHQQNKASSSPMSYQGSGSTHVPHNSVAGATVQQPLEEKVSNGSGSSVENSDDRVDNNAETKREEKSPEFGDKTSAKLSKRIVVT